VVPAGILGEAAYMIETILTTQALDAFLEDIQSGVYVVDWRRDDVSRIRYFTTRYASLPLGFADSSVVACAERNGARVLTLDRRSFDVVAREIPLNLLPD
jgi:predicted nucleic acid-binding protein